MAVFRPTWRFCSANTLRRRGAVLTEAAVSQHMAADTNMRVPDLAVSCSPDVPGEVGPDGSITLASVELTFPLRDAYSKTFLVA
jgi:hypothetical protein